MDWKAPFAEWFVGGKTNLCYNCVDKHLSGPRANKAAIIWQGEPGDTRVLTYQMLHYEVSRFANVLNVSGHRLSTIEIESALVSHPAVAEAAAVGRPHDIKGEAIAVFITLTSEYYPDDALRDVLKGHVRMEIGSLAVPDDLRFAAALPKTRSGKIMRRLLRDIAAGRETVGDTTTLEDYSVPSRLRSEED